jgi:hypothetical protein
MTGAATVVRNSPAGTVPGQSDICSSGGSLPPLNRFGAGEPAPKSKKNKQTIKPLLFSPSPLPAGPLPYSRWRPSLMLRGSIALDCVREQLD